MKIKNLHVFYMFAIDNSVNAQYKDRYVANVSSPATKGTKYLRFNKKDKPNSIMLTNDAVLQPIFNLDDRREIMYVAGRSNSGKTYFVNSVASDYHKKHPNRAIFYITKVHYDGGDKSLNMKLYIMVNLESFLDKIRSGEADIDDFKDSLVIFDDVGSVQGNDSKTMWWWIDQVLEVYRKNNTSLIMCNHLPTEYKKTRLMLAEMTKYVCFNNMKTRSDRVLLSYIEMSKEEVVNMLNIDSRWYLIDTVLGIVLTEHQAYKLK